MIERRTIAGLALSASALVSILLHEGYSDKAYTPVKGDRLTIGFGSANGVKAGDTIKPPQAVARALDDVQKFEGALKQCVKVPLHQYEYDAYVSLSYNIGSAAFCGSTLVKKLNAGDFDGACQQVLRWDRFKGKPLAGLTKRRQAEYEQCKGIK